MNNSITLIGRVGQNPKAIDFASGKKLVKFSLAVKEYPSSDKSKPPKTLWIDIETWNGQGQSVLAHITKGREVAVYGRLMVNNYSKSDGNGKTVEVSKPVVRLTGFHLCGSKKSEDATNVISIDKAVA